MKGCGVCGDVDVGIWRCGETDEIHKSMIPGYGMRGLNQLRIINYELRMDDRF